MYFTNNNNIFHGIMFHHFHDDKIHKKNQGSISQNEFYNLVKFIGRKNILNADDFFVRYKENKLTEKNVCFTFDDAIKSQYDIALPVLEDFKIKVFSLFIHLFLKGIQIYWKCIDISEQTTLTIWIIFMINFLEL